MENVKSLLPIILVGILVNQIFRELNPEFGGFFPFIFGLAVLVRIELNYRVINKNFDEVLNAVNYLNKDA